jgi:hypothetical protein
MTPVVNKSMFSQEWKGTVSPSVSLCNPTSESHGEAQLVVIAVPVAGVLFFSLSTSIVKSSFKNRNPIMENR